MSLTRFLNIKDVRKKFLEEYPTPRFNIKKEILCPPLTQDYGLVGTTFDYLLRFYIKYLNPKAITKQWVADSSLKLLELILEVNELLEKRKTLKNLTFVNKELVVEKLFKMLKLIEKRYAIKNHKQKIKIIKKHYQKAIKIISNAKKKYFLFLKNGQINDNLIKSTLLLAKLDPIYRAGHVTKSYNIDGKDIEDLNNLISLVNPDFFKANEICLLNPIFNRASILVGGADADLVIDDMLIDIKTTKKLQMNRNYFNQLIGYYTLYRIGGIDGMPPQNEIKKLGIYFSRYGYLHLYKVEDIINENRFTKFLEWFKERARQEFWKSKKLEDIL